MPVEAQLLYFHMILRADDDGVVESYPLMKLLGVAPDNFKVLLAKGFITQLNQDQVVVIMDWIEHNVIRADRKVDSIYKHLLPKDLKTIEAKPRSDVEDNSKRLGGQSTDGISKVKLSKVKTSKDKEEIQIPIDSIESKNINEVMELFRAVNPTVNRLFAHKVQRKSISNLLKLFPRPQLDRIIEVLQQTNAHKYAPKITTPLQLEENMGKLKAFIESQRQDKKSKEKVILGL